jgi:shikimate dehydrogenase
MLLGTSRIFGIIADPIDTVRTPQVMNGLFQDLNLDAAVVPFQVDAAGLPTMVAALRLMKNLGGIVVSHPHKSAMAPLCDEVSPRARAIGAVNAVRREADGRLVADMTDGAGFVRGAEAQGIAIAGRSVLLAGAGGAATAVAAAVVESGARSLTLTSLDERDARDIASRVGELFPSADIRLGPPDPTGHSLVINAVSPKAWKSGAHAIDTSRMSADMIAADTYSIPEITPFLERAIRKGCKPHYGRFMLDSQIPLIADFIGAIPIHER